MNKIYAFSDIHGNYHLLERILKYCDETDKLYFLGDAADRGPDGIKCIEALLNDNRVIYLLGNHEVMFINAYNEVKHQELTGEIDYFNSALLLWFNNGGDTTWNYFQEEYNQEQQKILINKLRHLPFQKQLNIDNNIITLSHSGGGDVWDRYHIETKLKNYQDNEYIVHGHTPTPSHYFGQKIDNPEIQIYSHGHKIDIDLGTYASNRTVLIDLSTIGANKEPEVIYFQD